MFLNGRHTVNVGATVACFRDDKGDYCFRPEIPDLLPELAKQISESMATLQLSYSNAVYDDVVELEDSGFAFFHVFEFEMAQEKYRHDRNKGLVYTVGPNGNKKRYPNDVWVQLTREQWEMRTRLTGRNVARCVKVYNEFAATMSRPQLTVLRTPLVSGGMFMLKDGEENPLINLDEHARYYMQGIVEEVSNPLTLANSGIKRLEFMTPEPKNPDAFKDGARLLLGQHPTL